MRNYKKIIGQWLLGIEYYIGIMVFLMFLLSLQANAQEPNILEYYTIEQYNDLLQERDSISALNNQNCDSLTNVIDSLEIVAQTWYDAFQFASDTSIKVGDHYFEIHDTVTGNWSEISTQSDEVWLTYYADSLRYHFWIVNREPENKHFEFWIGNGNGASQIMRMDTTQFQIEYKDLNKYFE